MMAVRLEPEAARSRVKHSTTEPLCSLQKSTLFIAEGLRYSALNSLST